MGKDKIEMTDDEKTRFAEAMKKPEFKKLFFEYMDEISDPEKRRAHAESILQYEEQLKGLKI